MGTTVKLVNAKTQEFEALHTPELSPEFRPTKEQRDALQEGLLRQPPHINGIANAMVARKRFNIIMGLHKGPTWDNPIPCSTHNEFSQMPKHSLANQFIERTIRADMPAALNMSIVEILDLEPCVWEVLHTECALKVKKGAYTAKELEEELSRFSEDLEVPKE